MSAEAGGAPREPGRAPQLRYRVAFFLTGLVVLSIVVTLPSPIRLVQGESMPSESWFAHQ